MRDRTSRIDDCEMSLYHSNQLSTSTASGIGGDFWDMLLSQRNFRRAISQKGYYEICKEEVLALFPSRTTYTVGVHSSIRSKRAHTNNIDSRHSSPAHSLRSRRNLRRIDNTATKPRAILLPPPFISERLSSIARALSDKQLYFVGTGRSNFAIFDKRKFFPPFLALYGQSSGIDYPPGTEELPIRLPPEYRDIARLFRQQWNEHTFLRALHFCGAFGSLVEKITHRGRRYVSGPSGPMMSRFPFWMKSSETSNLAPFVHEGNADMDECLYVKDSNAVIPIEAKLKHIPDLSWHKLAFPCYRFISQPSNPVEWLPARRGAEHEDPLYNEQQKWKSMYSMDPVDWHGDKSKRKKPKIIPVYCTCFKHYDSWRRGAILYVFPQANIHSGKVPLLSTKKVSGVILNDRKQMVPARIFKVELSWLRKS